MLNRARPASRQRAGLRLQAFGLLNATLDWKNALSSGLDLSLSGATPPCRACRPVSAALDRFVAGNR